MTGWSSGCTGEGRNDTTAKSIPKKAQPTCSMSVIKKYLCRKRTSFVREDWAMDTQPETTAPSFVYHRIPTKVSRKDFNRYIDPHLKKPKKGPKPKLSLYKIFNYILY